MLPISSKKAANPPAWSSRSVARKAWSSRVHGLARASPFSLRQRTHNSCFRLTPLAAADSGSKASPASTQAQTWPPSVLLARNARVRLVRPDDSGPVTSLIAPTGKPPSSNASTAATPVGATSRAVFGAGISAAGKRCSRVRSISRRKAEAEGMVDQISLFIRF